MHRELILAAACLAGTGCSIFPPFIGHGLKFVENSPPRAAVSVVNLRPGARAQTDCKSTTINKSVRLQ